MRQRRLQRPLAGEALRRVRPWSALSPCKEPIAGVLTQDCTGSPCCSTLTGVNPTSEPDRPSDGLPVVDAKASRWPMRLAIVAAVVAAACVSGLFIGYRAYDNATKPNRSAPDVVLDNYLRALLDHRDDAEATQYACADQSELAAFKAFRDSAVARAKSQGTAVSFEWVLEVRRHGNRAGAGVDLEIDATKDGSVVASSNSTWNFVITPNSDGWQVCSGTRLAPTPSPSLSP
jgi:hypothetical protein